jgi:hypothetical protein
VLVPALSHGQSLLHNLRAYSAVNTSLLKPAPHNERFIQMV